MTSSDSGRLTYQSIISFVLWSLTPEYSSYASKCLNLSLAKYSSSISTNSRSSKGGTRGTAFVSAIEVSKRRHLDKLYAMTFVSPSM